MPTPTSRVRERLRRAPLRRASLRRAPIRPVPRLRGPLVRTTLRRAPRWIGALLVALLALLTGAAAQAQASTQDAVENSAQDTAQEGAPDAAWEFRVCADPDVPPYSSRDGTGFENHLAELLAEEMGAELAYDWSPFSPDMVDLRLRAGECDAMMGVPDGYEGVLTTLTYYRSPFVFVTPADSGIEIGSLDDPILQDLRIGVENEGIPPHDALVNRGLGGNVHDLDAGEVNEPDRVIQELANDEIDVGLMWGPNAGHYAELADMDLELTPVTPEVDPPFLAMSVPMVMAVRQEDTSLRDRLDVALAERWEDVQALLTEYGVPLTPIPAPRLGSAAGGGASAGATPRGDARDGASGSAPGPVDVAVLLPVTTGRQANLTSLYEVVADAAFRGAELATTDLNAAAGADRYRLAVSSTPSAAAARRAAERLTSAVGAAGRPTPVLVGGIGEGQAEVLAEIATEREALFLDVGSTGPADAQRCLPTTFHLEAGIDATLAALLAHHAEQGVHEWFVIHEAGDEATLAAAEAAIAATEGASLAEARAVAPGKPTYAPDGAAIRYAAPDGVLVLLNPADQIAFLGQVRDMGERAVLAPLPLPVTQTRDFLGATMDRVAVEEPQVRVVAFEPTRPAPEAADEGAADGAEDRFADVVDRFQSRYAQPMEASAFAGYQAMLALDAAVANAGFSADGGVAAWAAYLADPDTVLAGPKGEVRFRADHHLVQPLDVIRIDPAAEWRNTLTGKLGIAEFVETRDDAAPALIGGGNGCLEPPRQEGVQEDAQ